MRPNKNKKKEQQKIPKMNGIHYFCYFFSPCFVSCNREFRFGKIQNR